MSLELTPLECELLERIHTRYAGVGFPSAAAFFVTRRENTGAGRFTHLDHGGELTLDRSYAGDLGQGAFSQFNMRGLDAGASFHVFVDTAKVKYLEILVNGQSPWDGQEGPFAICDPNTAR